ncbi:MAG: Prephenate dehydratase [Methanomassiliicoccales archaeon PtaU1.Bin124]|nr:MAG: Prephenate dehydratase [Methanomassiliicoccales archaeon PtaU1.Bin124]
MVAKKVVAFQGVHGAYSEDAIHQFFGEDVVTLPCAEFRDLLAAVDKGQATHGVIPVENSIEGSVTLANDLLLESDLTVVGEVLVWVRHCLIGHPGAEMKDVRKVYSHPQALGQCSKFLTSHAEWEKIPSYDTAGSVKMIKERGLKEEAAIASGRAAEYYGMKVLRADIQNSSRNFTRFFVLDKNPPMNFPGDKTSLAFTTKNVPGALHRCIGAFADHGVNITKLESRPRKERTWEYVFYIDIDGQVSDPNVKEALIDLMRKASFVKIFGSYQKAPLPDERTD